MRHVTLNAISIAGSLNMAVIKQEDSFLGVDTPPTYMTWDLKIINDNSQYYIGMGHGGQEYLSI